MWPRLFSQACFTTCSAIHKRERSVDVCAGKILPRFCMNRRGFDVRRGRLPWLLRLTWHRTDGMSLTKMRDSIGILRKKRQKQVNNIIQYTQAPDTHAADRCIQIERAASHCEEYNRRKKHDRSICEEKHQSYQNAFRIDYRTCSDVCA